MQRTELQSLGEFGLIKRLHQNVKIYHSGSALGIGDDAAVIDHGTDQYQLMTTDMLLEGIHFDLSYYPLKHLGYKAVTVNLSDIAAMNGIPQQITVGLGLSNRFSVEAVEELYQGIYYACEQYKVDLVGGDTTASRSGLVIAITATGTVAKNRVAYRKNAQINDIICVSGDLGGAYLGLQVLEQEKQVFLANPEMQPQLSGKDYIVGRQLRPEARTDLVYEFIEQDLVPTAMIDVSDGLASELLHICQQSQMGAVIFEDKIPIDALSVETAMDFNLNPTTCALNGGEDYELLFTIKPADFNKIKNNPHITPIGYIREPSQGVMLHTRGDSQIPITAQGWTHF
ncbi:MAG: thiamine-phosphate kinase [Microscillaceae bacterium]|jgi:thiamine-monophosphate kinase|nr:thiamine-phosphate kinase [Microscillaceae bacterium]